VLRTQSRHQNKPKSRNCADQMSKSGWRWQRPFWRTGTTGFHLCQQRSKSFRRTCHCDSGPHKKHCGRAARRTTQIPSHISRFPRQTWYPLNTPTSHLELEGVVTVTQNSHVFRAFRILDSGYMCCISPVRIFV